MSIAAEMASCTLVSTVETTLFILHRNFSEKYFSSVCIITWDQIWDVSWFMWPEATFSTALSTSFAFWVRRLFFSTIKSSPVSYKRLKKFLPCYLFSRIETILVLVIEIFPKSKLFEQQLETKTMFQRKLKWKFWRGF